MKLGRERRRQVGPFGRASRGLGRPVGLLGRALANTVSRDMEFRADLLLRLAGNTLEVAAPLLFFGLVYLELPAVGGWTLPQTLVVVATNSIVSSLHAAFFAGVGSLPRLVESGELDRLLVRPVSVRFQLVTARIEYEALANLVPALAVLAYAVPRLGPYLPVTPWSALAYAVLVLAGLWLRHTLTFLVLTLSFWLVRVYALHSLVDEFLVITRYPAGVFGGAARVVFSFIVPVLVVANFPAMALWGALGWATAAGGLAAVGVLSWAAARLWSTGLAAYTSAGG